MLQGKTSRLGNPVIVDFVQIHFRGRIVSIVLMRRIARPVSTWRINLDHHQFVGRKRRGNHVDDLPRGVPSAPEAAYDVVRRNQSRFETGLGRHTAFCNFAGRFRRKGNARCARANIRYREVHRTHSCVFPAVLLPAPNRQHRFHPRLRMQLPRAPYVSGKRRRAVSGGQRNPSTPRRLSGEADRGVYLPAGLGCARKGTEPCCRSNHRPLEKE